MNRNRWREYGFALGTVLLAASALISSPVQAVDTTPYDTNLVHNPGAEEVGDTIGEIPSWTPTSSFTTEAYDAPAFPTSADGPPDHGNSFFSCGNQPANNTATLTQKISLHGLVTDIDAGRVRLKFTAWLATFSDQDEARMDLTTASSGDTAMPGGLSASRVQTYSHFQKISLSGLLRYGTRSVTVTLTGTKVTGQYCDAYFDSVSVKLHRVGATALNHQLLINPGAENGPGTNGTTVMNAPGWYFSRNGGTVLKYAAPGFPTPAQADAIGGGAKLFCPWTADSFSQQRSVTGRSTEMADSRLVLKLTARAAGVAANQVALITVYFSGSWGVDIGRIDILAPLGHAHRFRSVSLTQAVPRGTEVMSVAVGVSTKPTEANHCMGYVDNVKLVLQKSA